MFHAYDNRRQSYERPPARHLAIDGDLYGPRDDGGVAPPQLGPPQNYAAYPRSSRRVGHARRTLLPPPARRGEQGGGGSGGGSSLSSWAAGLRAEFFAADAEVSGVPDPAPAAAAATAKATAAGQALERAKRRLYAARIASVTAREEEASSTDFTKHSRPDPYRERQAELERQRATTAAALDSAIRTVSAAVEEWRAAEVERVRLAGMVRRRKIAAARRWEVLDELFNKGGAGDAAENAAERAREAAVAHKQQVASAM